MIVESAAVLVFLTTTPKFELTMINKMFIDMTSLNLASLSLKRALKC